MGQKLAVHFCIDKFVSVRAHLSYVTLVLKLCDERALVNKTQCSLFSDGVNKLHKYYLLYMSYNQICIIFISYM